MSTVTLVFTDNGKEVEVFVDFGEEINEKSSAHIYAVTCLETITKAEKETE